MAILYMILIACNDANGIMQNKAWGVEIFLPNDHCDPVFIAETNFDDSPVPFWETKNGLMFQMTYRELGRVVQVKRHFLPFLPCLHGAHHVGNIVCNAYFAPELIAKRFALEIMSAGELFPDGEWEGNAARLIKDLQSA